MFTKQYCITIVCKPGPFAEQLKHEGACVIETDYSPFNDSKILDDIETLHEKHPIDIVHAHPFASRKLGLIVSQVLGLPFVVTLHGRYQDELPSYIEQTDAVITVSEGIKHYLLTEGGVDVPEKLHVVPNTPDASLFLTTNVVRSPDTAKRAIISLVTRLDQDKIFILDVFYQAVAHAAEHYPGFIHWQIVGKGTLEQKFTNNVEALRGDNTVSYTGWLRGEALRDAYCVSDAVIAPGRSALEAMICGVPVIALGSKGYNGLVGPKTWQQAMFSNFGGVGNKHEDYNVGAVEHDLDNLMISASFRQRLGSFGQQIVNQFFNADEMHRKLLGFYNLALAAYKAQPRETLPKSHFLTLRLRYLHLEQPDSKTLLLTMNCEYPEGLKFAWYLMRDDKVIDKYSYRSEPSITITFPSLGRFQVRCFIKDEKMGKISVLSPIIEVLDE